MGGRLLVDLAGVGRQVDQTPKVAVGIDLSKHWEPLMNVAQDADALSIGNIGKRLGERVQTGNILGCQGDGLCAPELFRPAQPGRQGKGQILAVIQREDSKSLPAVDWKYTLGILEQGHGVDRAGVHQKAPKFLVCRSSGQGAFDDKAGNPLPTGHAVGELGKQRVGIQFPRYGVLNFRVAKFGAGHMGIVIGHLPEPAIKLGP